MSNEINEFRRPPGPETPVALGIDAETLEALTDLRDRYGNMVCVEKPSGRLAYFINDAHEVRRILLRRHSKYRKGPGFERVKMLLGNGLIVSDDDVWRRSRTMIQPAFSRQNVHQLVGAMSQCALSLTERWQALAESGEPLNINVETSDFALQLILLTIFGDDYEKRILAQGENPFSFLAEDSTRDLSVVMKVRQLRNFMLEIIADRRQADQSEVYDFLSMYIQATDKQGQPFNDKELLDELMTLIVAGFETSANTLAWVWYLLSGHADVEQRLLDEIADCMPDLASVSAENAARMTYTQQVLEEALRLYPPVWLFTRRACELDELDDYDVPPDADVYLSPYLLHRTEAYWPNPDVFDPDRFELGDKPKKDRPYFPFSLGPRRCLGEYFSFLEMKIHLALLLPKVRMMRCSSGSSSLQRIIRNFGSNSARWIFISRKEKYSPRQRRGPSENGK